MNRKKHIKEIIDSWHSIHQNLRVYQAEQVKETDHLPFSGCLALDIIKNQKNTTVKNISRILGLTSSAITQITNELEKTGLIKRKQHPADGRSQILEITETGNKRAEKVHNELTDYFAKAFENLSDDEIKQFAELTKKINK